MTLEIGRNNPKIVFDNDEELKELEILLKEESSLLVKYANDGETAAQELLEKLSETTLYSKEGRVFSIKNPGLLGELLGFVEDSVASKEYCRNLFRDKPYIEKMKYCDGLSLKLFYAKWILRALAKHPGHRGSRLYYHPLFLEKSKRVRFIASVPSKIGGWVGEKSIFLKRPKKGEVLYVKEYQEAPEDGDTPGEDVVVFQKKSGTYAMPVSDALLYCTEEPTPESLKFRLVRND